MSKVDELQADVNDLRMLLEKSSRQRNKDILMAEIAKLEMDLQSRKAAVDSATKQTVNRPQGCYDVKLTNYGWDQSDKFVKLYVDLPNVHTLTKENVSSQFTQTSMQLFISALDNKNYTLTINNLLNPIVPEESYIKIKTNKVVVFLKKQSTKNWDHISIIEKKAKESKTPKIEDGADPSSSLMNLMKQMYEEGDDEMKRTIAKAWTQSREKSSVPDI